MGAQTHINIWKNALKIIKQEIPDHEFEAWFKPLKPVQYKQNEKNIIIAVPSHYFLEYIEGNYLDILKKALWKVIGKGAKLSYKVKMLSQKKTHSTMTLPQESIIAKTQSEDLPKFSPPANPFIIPGVKKYKFKSQLNSKFVFKNFVVGESNRIPYSVAQKIAQNPGDKFNPFFLFGPTGVGKTHLLQAIGNKINELFPDYSVVYVNAYNFQTQYTSASQKNEINDFIYFYQNIDVLLIDDIQVLANKEKTQKTFFNIFNYLAQINKQIVITSDKAPAELTGMHERLISRFSSGLMAEITPPDFNLRYQILKNLAEKEGLKISDKILRYIAENVTNNIRALEGTLISIMAYSVEQSSNITLDFVKHFINKVVKKKRGEITLNKITKIVADVMNIKEHEIKLKKRTAEIVLARQLSMYFAKKYTNLSLKSIGKELGNKDHSTVLHSIKVINNLLEYDKNIKNYVDIIERRLNY